MNTSAGARIPVTIVNHVCIDIARPPAIVWAAIVDEYVKAEKFKAIGYAVEPIDDLGAVLGGYRLRFEQDGTVVDERVCHISEFDDGARRLSMVARDRSTRGGMTVHATYHAQDVASGTRFAIDCHSDVAIELPSANADAGLKAIVDAMVKQYDEALSEYLKSVKATLESKADRATQGVRSDRDAAPHSR